jgi:hypothetical protein
MGGFMQPQGHLQVRLPPGSAALSIVLHPCVQHTCTRQAAQIVPAAVT